MSIRQLEQPELHSWRLIPPSAVLAGVAIIDQLFGGNAIFVGFLAGSPLLASGLLDVPRTAVFAVGALAYAIALGPIDGIWGTGDHILRCVIVLTIGAMSVWVARLRAQREEALSRVVHVAEVAQQAILRPVPRVVGDVAFATRYQSSSHEALIGGDLYDVIDSEFGVRAIVGDVRGKGLEAVGLASLVLGAFREAAYTEDKLTEVSRRINESCRRSTQPEDFVTAVLVEFDDNGEISVLNHGHHPPLRMTHTGQTELLYPSRRDQPLALEPSFVLDTFGLDVGDRLLLYTDGLVECRDAVGSFFPLLSAAEKSLHDESLEAAVDELLRLANDHTRGDMDDDVAMVLAERLS